jgi:lipopolysaccharide biosynthesis regulator YciM
MKKILELPNKFKFFAARHLSNLALQEKSYHYSLEFGLMALEINKQDPELIELLVNVYATLESWGKMGDMIDRLAIIDQKRFAKGELTISNYYLKAAKHFIGLGQVQESIFYLGKCLEYQADSLRCIKLIAKIHLESKELDLKSIIEKAFSVTPSFELFLIYYQNYKNYFLANDIYNNLTSKIDKAKHQGLIIAMAYLLNIKSELDAIVSQIV